MSSSHVVVHPPRAHRLPRLSRPRLLLALPVAAAFVFLGVLGLYRYVDNFWLYRGFPPPKDPAFVTQTGTQETISVTSAALGGRAQQVVVYLPPGYDTNAYLHYPVLYLLHGFPGRPLAFLQTVRMGVWVDVLMAKQQIAGVILVMPFGSTGQFTDKEWANGVAPNEDWETFVARDVVGAIDSRYRTIPDGAARAIAGLSEGGYGALNIGLHHPGEFHVIESWSGYERADRILAIFADTVPLLDYNSPSAYLPSVAAELRRTHTYVWFYSGAKDRLLAQNRAFAGELARYRVAHRFFVVRGGHTWSAWRDNAEAALLAAARRIRAPAVIP
jgi:enterochelin esterase-like enzyme